MELFIVGLIIGGFFGVCGMALFSGGKPEPLCYDYNCGKRRPEEY